MKKKSPHNKGELGIYVPKGITKVHNGIYAIINIFTLKIYVGSGTSIISRIKNHRKDLRNNRHKNVYLQRAFNKWGEKSFFVIVLEVFEGFDKFNPQHRQELLDKETKWIEITRASERNFGYNIHQNARANRGFKLPKERVEKMKKRWTPSFRSEWSKRQKAYWEENPEQREYFSNMYTGEGNPFYGKTHNEETRKKIKAARAEQEITPNMLESLKLGHGTQSWTEETWRKLREKNLGELNPASKLKKDQVLDILKRLNARKLTGEKQSDIAKDFNVSANVVTNIKKGNRWGHLRDEYPELYEGLS
ncbi:GIY-YIG nuclease family protein [Bacillus sp. CRN 9]|nr:GIY-YIG nuclease family protein [Bacillus sp. CRN 9]